MQPADAEDGVRTAGRVRSTGVPLIASQDWHYPLGQPIHGTIGYGGTIAIRAVCRLMPDAPSGVHVLRATLSAQLCTATACLAPEQITLEIPVTIRSA